MGLREQRVEQERLVPLGDEPVRDMGPDEPGTAGDQYAHSPTLATAGAGDPATTDAVRLA